MNINESIVEDAALEWFGELGYGFQVKAQEDSGVRVCFQLTSTRASDTSAATPI